jgi:hypothetical protein
MRVSYNTYKLLIELSDQVSEITDLYENHDFTFSTVVKRWLMKLEQIYNQNGLPSATQFSTARLQIIATERGVLKEGEYLHNSRSKQVASVTIQAVLRSATLLQLLTSAMDEEFSRAKTLIRKLLIDAISSAKINGSLKDYSDSMEAWRQLLVDPKTSSLAAQVLEKISYSDAAFLLIEGFSDLGNEQREIVRNSIHRDDNSSVG